MSDQETKGKALTVLGPIDPDALGITITHEHLLIDLSVVFVDPIDEDGRRLAEEPVGIGNLGWIRVNWSSNRDNLVQRDVDLAAREAVRYRTANGGTLVDVTSVAHSGNPGDESDIIGVVEVSDFETINALKLVVVERGVVAQMDILETIDIDIILRKAAEAAGHYSKPGD